MENIFALDVGTRNVVGLIFDYTDDKIKVKQAVSIEHETRAMEDGQIHDISKVARTVDKIKKILQEKSGKTITEVAVAVAGRSLITHKGSAKKELNQKHEITEEDVLALELGAIQNSLTGLDENYRKLGREYHCVGYTVSEFRLDGDYIKNPVYQKGQLLEIEIMATFLPKIVVDSMFTMAKKVDLEIINLTLEPIAAINVVIPEDMRKLNLALVDIGAGTSDIAVTKDGKVIGYEMVPMAGDEVTEKIANELLLDFTEAERVKRELCRGREMIKYSDILGLEYNISASELSQKVEDVIDDLGKKIADKIMELNAKAPQAVILIGGGSLVPMLKERLSASISLPAGRVAVRGTEVIKNFEDLSGLLTTAEYVTPVGIANMAVKGRGFKIISLTINNSTYRVFSFKNSMSIMDAFLSAGIDSKELYSKHGNPVTVKINGKLEVIKGEPGRVAVIKVNGEVKNLDDEVEDGSDIEIIKQRDGRDAVAKAMEIKERFGKFISVKVNGIERKAAVEMFVNDSICSDDYIINDRDILEFKEKFTVRDIMSEDEKGDKAVGFEINGKLVTMEIPAVEIKRNGVILSQHDEVYENDIIEISHVSKKSVKVRDIVELPEEIVEVTVNGRKVNFGIIKGKVTKNNVLAGLDEEITSGDSIEVKGIEESLPMVSDVFRFYEPEQLGIDMRNGLLKIIVNGTKSEYTTKVRNRDIITLSTAGN